MSETLNMADRRELKSGAWYRMRTGHGETLLVCALRPTAGVVRELRADGLSAPVVQWPPIDEHGHAHSLTVFDIGAQRIGGIVGPVDDMPPMDAEMEKALIAKREQAMHAARVKLQEKAQREDAIRRELPAQYPHLVPTAKTPGKSNHAAGVANIRRELAKAFPGVKFRITSKSYSGGCSIDVGWEYGPTTDQVEPILRRYETRDFDGMQDLETVRENTHADVFGGAGYVHPSRDYPVDNSKPGEGWFDSGIYGLVARELCRLQGVAYTANPWQRGLCGNNDCKDLSSHCNELLHRTAFPAGFTLAQFGGVERAEWKDGEGYVGGHPWNIVIKAAK